ncbi:CYTH and CHAD domain-containing protein [Blastococcus sp. Marseille-P5729]|uniref:CYTH and CHAD domain-containing protein n=1 Tax=Blastococcus sp. Marseille-P5729 TaxID=2086582 RepID=UPI000D0FFDC2|nr:CYTH and CHAD domain-containing protein [Blastococcus sp. Marseille-P5729]
MSISETIEIERKYAAPARNAVPKLDALPAVDRVRRRRATTLQAQYFDTDDLTLIGAHVTLRKRVGGIDEGWHLKLPAQGYRHELHSPLTDSDDVPDAFLVRLHPLLRGRALRPVVRLTTRRTVHELLDPSGGLLAEVCDDRVESKPDIDGLDEIAWREWEVELHAADPALLDAIEPLLIERGASADVGPSKLARALAHLVPDGPPQPAPPGKKPTVADVAREYLWQEIGRLKDHDAGARLHEPDAVHQMRVAARRLRSVLSSYRDIVGRERSAELRGELKALADSLGGARDSEVMLARLNALLDAQPPETVLGPVRERINDELTARYDEAHADAMKFMSSGRYYALLDALDALVLDWEPAGGTEPAKALRGVFDRDWKRVRGAVHEANEIEDQAEHEHALHEVRKSAKRLRYGMDSAHAVIGKDAKKLAKASAAITEILGDHNDSVITAGVIAALAEKAHARGEDTFTYGRMHAQEQAHASVSREELTQALDTLNELRFDAWKKI